MVVSKGIYFGITLLFIGLSMFLILNLPDYFNPYIDVITVSMIISLFIILRVVVKTR